MNIYMEQLLKCNVMCNKMYITLLYRCIYMYTKYGWKMNESRKEHLLDHMWRQATKTQHNKCEVNKILEQQI